MSAGIDTMAYAGETPWHKLGTKVDKAMTAAEALTAAGLDWKVEKRPITFVNALSGLTETIPDHFAVVRTDREKSVGVVGRVYQPLQNQEAFSFFDAVVQEKLAMYHTAGSLWGGSRIWLMAKLPQTVKVMGVDKVDFYTLLVNGHDGGCGVRMRHTSVRVVCWNTLTAALGEEGRADFNVRHTRNLGEKVKQAREVLGIMTRSTTDFLDAADAMARKKLNGQIVEDFLAGIGLKKESNTSARYDNKRMDIMRLIESGYGHDLAPIRNSLWTAVNAVTQYVDHDNGSRSDDQKLASQWFQGGETMKDKALRTALMLAK
jgi:phage/plasmid-like protein (TIGR03299 family)